MNNNKKALEVGFEPTTQWLTATCSTPELHEKRKKKLITY